MIAHTISIALYQPEIPANTGNIGRVCVGTGSDLYLIGKCGFLLRDREIKRAGLDYWDKLILHREPTFESFLAAVGKRRIIIVSKFAPTTYWDKEYRADDVLLFGNESSGLPDAVHTAYRSDGVHIPMTAQIRSHNLANSVAVVCYEAIRFLTKA
ncbi:MAG: tRNA (cytidine(34)-2'-O)-methyltransferase [Spirochaetes bacterium]|nr:tRNA (cytidine(34)-2'-O)-methyltransferase [Spirochaetota bacterium]